MSELRDQKFILLLQDTPDEPWRPQVLNEDGLSRFAEAQHYAPDPYPYLLLWASWTGAIWPVEVTWKTTPFDADDYADTQGIMTANGVVVGQLGFRVDGRA